jgi:plasmid stabilization system protein ParE
MSAPISREETIRRARETARAHVKMRLVDVPELAELRERILQEIETVRPRFTRSGAVVFVLPALRAGGHLVCHGAQDETVHIMSETEWTTNWARQEEVLLN